MAYRRSGSTAWRAVGDETVVVNLETRMIYGLNQAGGLVWEALEQAGDERRLATALGLDASSTAEHEALRSFLAELVDEGLLVRLETAPVVALLERAGEMPAGWPPAVAWREGLERAVGQCGFHSGEGGLCDPVQGGIPYNS